MIKENKVYETSDGKSFKTKKGAENHQQKISVEEVTKRLEMTKDEVSINLNRVTPKYPTVKALLKHEPDWTKWGPGLLKMINKELLSDLSKRTLYIFEKRKYGKVNEDILFEEEGAEFSDPELHCKDEYKVSRVESVDEFTRKVYYDNKYTWEEQVVKKLKEGTALNEEDIRAIVMEFPEVHREEGEDRRWSRSILSIIDIEDEFYAVEWEKGLTESQPNEFYEQPYPVELKTEEVVITKTVIVKK